MTDTEKDEKWACSRCTYLNFVNSMRCTICSVERDGSILISSLNIRDEPDSTCAFNEPEPAIDESKLWPCPLCTYLNSVQTTSCTLCSTDRPVRYEQMSNSAIPEKMDVEDLYGSDDNSSNPVAQQEVAASRHSVLKWSCPTCSFLNWPRASKCTMCTTVRPLNCSVHNENEVPARTPASTSDYPTDIESTSISGPTILDLSMSDVKFDKKPVDYFLDNYGTFSSGDKYFLKTAVALIDPTAERFVPQQAFYFLSNDGNPYRRFTTFECRLINASVRGRMKVTRNDCIIELARKTDLKPIYKMFKRVANGHDEKLPCALDSSLITDACSKVARSFKSYSKDGVNLRYLKKTHNFNILAYPVNGTEMSNHILSLLCKPCPSIPPTIDFVDCFDSNQAGIFLGKPTSLALMNRGSSSSLCDAVMQFMYGLCDRFSLLRDALAFNISHSTNKFEARWREHVQRMARECALILSDADLKRDWEDIVTAVTNPTSALEPIHVFVLAHVIARPIIVIMMDEAHNEEEMREKESCKNTHCYEGIYLPVLLPISLCSRSPVILGYQNGSFHALVTSEIFYENNSATIYRNMRLRRSRSTFAESKLRFLTRSERENLNIGFTYINMTDNRDSLIIDRLPKRCLYDITVFYAEWIRAVNQCAFVNSNEVTLCGIQRELLTANNMLDFSVLSEFAVRNTNRRRQCLNQGDDADMIMSSSDDSDCEMSSDDASLKSRSILCSSKK
uniref:Ubiquitinyl hydrolase 1 n=1 Tax=Steinernema glaseri TaxID=37863 RepID=A0A1I7Z2U7_9BILA